MKAHLKERGMAMKQGTIREPPSRSTSRSARNKNTPRSVPVTARKDDAAAAYQAAIAKVAVSVSSACDGGLIQTTSG